jgi:hypothetical protein
LATDFFTVGTVALHGFFVLFVVGVARRVAHLLGATANLHGPRMAQVARNFAADIKGAGREVRVLVRDRDTESTTSLDHISRRSSPRESAPRRARPHAGLGPLAERPSVPGARREGRVRRHDLPGGLIHEYELAA